MHYGHRIRVLDIVLLHEHQGLTPDDIVSQSPSITLADVNAALAYYFDHMDEIREEMRSERAAVEDLRLSSASLLDAKLHRRRLEDASAVYSRAH